MFGKLIQIVRCVLWHVVWSVVWAVVICSMICMCLCFSGILLTAKWRPPCHSPCPEAFSAPWRWEQLAACSGEPVHHRRARFSSAAKLLPDASTPTFMQKISEFVGFVLKLYGKVSIFGPFLTLNAPKNPNFEFSWQIGLCQFSRLVVPYLHAKNQKICRRG